MLNHAGLRRYLANTSWLMAENVLRLISGLLVGIWVARYLGPIQFGVFSYVLAYTSIFAGIAKLGLDGIVIKELVTQPEKCNFYMGTTFWLKLAGAMLTIGIISVAVKFTSNDAATCLYIYIISASLFFQSFEVVDFYFQAQVQAKFVSICKVLQLIVSTILKVYLVLARAELLWFVIVTLFDSFILAFSLFIAYRLKEKRFFFRYFDWHVARSLLKDSWPLIMAGLVVMIYLRIDQIMIKELLGEREVGVYSAAVRLSEAWYFIPLLIANSLFPAILNAKKASQELYYQRLQRLFTLMIWLAIAFSSLTTLFSKPIILNLYGEAYLEASKVLNIHVWAGMFVFLGEASNKWFLAEGLNMMAFWRTFWGMIVNILLNFMLIPTYGIQGAAVATLMAYAVAGFLFDLFSKKTRLLFSMKMAGLDPRRLS